MIKIDNLEKFYNEELDYIIECLEKEDVDLCSRLKEALCFYDMYHYSARSITSDRNGYSEYRLSCNCCDKKLEFNVKLLTNNAK